MNNLHENMLDEEIVAAISAALASVSTRPGNRLVVKNIRRIPQSAPVWNSTGRIERMRNDMNS